MSIPGLGDGLMLFDLSIRITTFINDLRHAQDDFLGLRAEADCLRICINSLNSPQNLETLYHYITEDQGRDLKSIVENCELNMVDLNKFVTSSAKIIEDDVGVKKSLIGRKGGWGRRLREAIAKGWAKWKFTMTDKQAFRDKLMLPTASINVFLTSLTHVGLARVGKLMVSNGHLPANAGVGAGWGATMGGGSGGLNGWEVIGRRVAFRENVVWRGGLTEEIEEEVLEYVKHLMSGGQPFYVKTTDAGEAGGTSKVIMTTKTRTRSRSRGPGAIRLGKESRSGQMYLVRKKSVSRPSTERIEIVEEFASRPHGEGGHGRLLALPAPATPHIVDVHNERQPQCSYVERKPKWSSSDGSDSGEDMAGIRMTATAGMRDRRRSRMRETERERVEAMGTGRPSARSYTEQELKARRQKIRNTILEEKGQVIEEIEQKERQSRMRRRMSRHNTLTPEEEPEAKEEEIEDTIEFLEREYGVTVERVEVPREPIDNGQVKTVEPPCAASGFVSHQLSDSEESDTPIIQGLSRADRLRAETSLPEYSIPRQNRSFRSRRWEPYSIYDREKFKGPRRFYHYADDHLPSPSDIIHDGHDPGKYHRSPSRDYYSRYGDESFDESFDELRPAGLDSKEDELYLMKKREDRKKSSMKPGIIIREDRKKSSMKPAIIIRNDEPSNRSRRAASYGGEDPRHESEVRRREIRRHLTGQEQDDIYMSGALSPDDSDDGTRNHIRIVRR